MTTLNPTTNNNVIDIPAANYSLHKIIKKLWQQHNFTYNADEYNFKTTAIQLFDAENADLENLHERYLSAENAGDSTDVATLPPPLYRAELLAGFRKKVKKEDARAKLLQSKNWKQNLIWNEVFVNGSYFRLIKEVVVRQIAQTMDTDDLNADYKLHGILYQESPILRVIFPQAKSVPCRPHCDAEYYPEEDIVRQESNADTSSLPSIVDRFVNYWIPITKVNKRNTLYLESQPGKDDYRPIETETGCGDGVRFWGMRCNHFTVVNGMGDDTDEKLEVEGADDDEVPSLTRVSFDFRVLPIWRRRTNATTDCPRNSTDEAVKDIIINQKQSIDLLKVTNSESIDECLSAIDIDVLETKRFKLGKNQLGIFKFVGCCED